MNSMEIDRRSLLLGTVTALGSGLLSRRSAFGAPALGPAYVSAAKLPDGGYCIVTLAADGTLIRQIPLSDRGHDIAIDKTNGRAVAFARRPGTFAIAFTPQRDAPPVVFSSPAGRHFFGHGVFSADGRLLYASENEISSGEGVIGIYDVAAGYRRIGEHRSHGIGPHELILMPDRRTLAVANGGIDTTPEAGRENLNVETMQASLVFIDAVTGALVTKHELQGDLQKLSIRHLAADAHNRIWFGGQWQGDAQAAPELIGSASCDAAIKLIAPQAPLGTTLKGYIGSMAASTDGSIIAASAPKAGQAVFIDAATGGIAGISQVKDVCGIAGVEAHEFALTSGFGSFRLETDTAAVMSAKELANIAFDNHLRRLI